MKIGGGIFFKGQHLLLDQILGSGGASLSGGIVYFDCERTKYQSLVIKNSVFFSNTAMNGGVMSVSFSVKNADIIIRNNYFYGNHGSCLILFLISSFHRKN